VRIAKNLPAINEMPTMHGQTAVLSVAFAITLSSGPATAQDTAEPALKTLARQFVEQLDAREYEKAVQTFDATMTRVMPPDKLRDAWQSLPPKAGDFHKIVGVAVVKKGNVHIAIVTCRFEKGYLDAKVVYDTAGKISGLWFAPASPPASPPPPYANPKSFTEQDVTVGSGWWALPGTLSQPVGEGPFPAVVLVHGSGPNDRDETIGPNKPFRDLAWGLASQGIAVLRYEKRTRHHQLKMALVAGSLTVKEETIDDAVAAVATLRSSEKINAEKINVLGHSLGGMLIPRIAKRDKDVAGFVILAGTSRPLEDILLEQMNYVLSVEEGHVEKERRVLEKLMAQVDLVKSPDLSKDTPAGELPLGVPAAYWLDLRDYEPAKEAAKLQKPLLIMQAGRDYQVTMDDYRIWQQALSDKSNVGFRLYPKCNHLFIEGEGQCTPAEYATPGHVAKKAIDDIANWLRRHP
jgi:uncharacterized protein